MTVSIFAPAKINLYLHVTERLPNGYHALDSLMTFADIGDQIRIEEADEFAFEIDGPFAGAFEGADAKSGPDGSNLVVKAARALAAAASKSLNYKIILTKNLPLGAGIGGGSADAAAVLWGLLSKWDIPKNVPYLDELMVGLGADVPVCFWSRDKRVRGIGEIFDPVDALPEIPIVLVHPGKPCSTPSVFSNFKGTLKTVQAIPDHFENAEDLISFLRNQENDLSEAAQKIVPEIKNILSSLAGQDGCNLDRMSGAGSTCFGLFENENAAQNAAHNIKQDNPDWWVETGTTGLSERY